MSNSIEELINTPVAKPPIENPPKAPVEPAVPTMVVLPAKPDTELPIVTSETSITKEEEPSKKDCFYCKAEKVIRVTQGVSFVLTLLALIYFLIKQAKNGRGRE